MSETYQVGLTTGDQNVEDVLSLGDRVRRGGNVIIGEDQMNSKRWLKLEEGEEYSIGRSDENDIVIDDAGNYISREHGAFEIDSEEKRYEHKGRNPANVDGETLKQGEEVSGDLEEIELVEGYEIKLSL